jgi:hypothetical protein
MENQFWIKHSYYFYAEKVILKYTYDTLLIASLAMTVHILINEFTPNIR